MKIKSPGQGRSQKPPDVSGTVTLAVRGGGGRGDPERPLCSARRISGRDVPGHRVKRGVREQMLPVRLASCQLREGATPALPPGTPVRPGHGPDSSQRRVWFLGTLGSQARERGDWPAPGCSAVAVKAGGGQEKYPAPHGNSPGQNCPRTHQCCLMAERCRGQVLTSSFPHYPLLGF